MPPKILVVLTSHDEIPGVGPTGWYLPELAHPYEKLHKKTTITVASPKGGKAPLDPGSVKMFSEDPVCKDFLSKEFIWSDTKKLSDMNEKDFDAIFYVGGHGPMFDLTKNPTSISLIESFASKKKLISAVCHAPCVFLYTQDNTGVPLISGKEVTGFSNAEEDAVGLSAAMPFMLEDELGRVSGGNYVKAAEDWGVKVVREKSSYGGWIVMGQNPGSAGATAEEILKVLGA
ncbi:ThiJ/PfpI [Penicillium angulare]|uniref:ThiJ/PfpI n=1 Tax=Penicillium angulare TaxID=116970 RepID=UPI0025421B85|nr:ThiJ/PfpI [Penicillium angulare]KAJ5289147.1 ThiJ/PfpI [Penicillium angulare]